MSGGQANAYENFDLKAEAEEARDPRIRFAFEFPELLERFREADAAAGAAKRLNRQLGYFSVGLVFVALAAASAAPLLKPFGHDIQAAFAYGSAVLGLAGTALGFAGMRRDSSRRRWLHNRLRTETMRILHFHLIAARLPEIAAIGPDEAAQAAYRAARDAALAQLHARVLADPEAELQRIAKSHDVAAFEIEVAEAPIPANMDTGAFANAVAAWRRLRIDWQLNYCEAKLAHGATGGQMSSRQTEHAFARIAWGAVAAIIVLHFALLGADVIGVPMLWVEVLVVWTALAALAVRALEDGLQPQREVERYEQYRANILVTRERLARAPDIAAQLETIRAFERVSLEEMRVFMRTHARSKFLL